MPVYGRLKKTRNRHWNGLCNHLCNDPCVYHLVVDGHLYSDPLRSHLSAYIKFHFSDRGGGQFTEMVVRKTSPTLYRLLGIFLPLITTNCAVLGVALLNINQSHNFLQSAVYGFGAAVGFSLVMVLFAAIRERLAVADVPAPFRGSSIALVTAGLMSLAFMGFSGLVKF